jgi:hypothetical protein
MVALITLQIGVARASYVSAHVRRLALSPDDAYCSLATIAQRPNGTQFVCIGSVESAVDTTSGCAAQGKRRSGR